MLCLALPQKSSYFMHKHEAVYYLDSMEMEQKCVARVEMAKTQWHDNALSHREGAHSTPTYTEHFCPFLFSVAFRSFDKQPTYSTACVGFGAPMNPLLLNPKSSTLNSSIIRSNYSTCKQRNHPLSHARRIQPTSSTCKPTFVFCIWFEYIAPCFAQPWDSSTNLVTKKE